MTTTTPQSKNSQGRLENSLNQLLQKQQLADISVSQIASQAGLSRASFYNYYQDKYDIIERCQQKVFQELENCFRQFSQDKRACICQIFTILAREELFTTLLLPQGSKEIHDFLSYKFQDLVRLDLASQTSKVLQNFTDKEIDYCVTYLSGAYFKVCQAWIEQGKREKPDQMAGFLLKMLTLAHGFD
ncbi:TetR/AcrR family transcriptional regulator [Streptococcus cuniculipharyngis]|uniref:TetR family transcriptional regulator n=1 Tax=Streptococcus cuniculipharyngis TaxID=1562651 RepID=A0A5C5SDQ1_9STRE|nr:TetR/AcrR family transcriptional regulator [Streptococcus cuniculipharyngis]TWS98914.1 TetR family transcriptional regulator [Streptococcus cuniculipharyngis]